MPFSPLGAFSFNQYAPQNPESPGAYLAYEATAAHDATGMLAPFNPAPMLGGLAHGAISGAMWGGGIAAGGALLGGATWGGVGAAAMTGAVGGALTGGIAAAGVALVKSSASIVKAWERLGKASESLSRQYEGWSSKLSRMADTFENMRERIDQKWAHAIENFTSRWGNRAANITERWEDLKIGVFKSFEPLLNSLLERLSRIAELALKILETLSRLLKEVIDIARLLVAGFKDLLQLLPRLLNAVGFGKLDPNYWLDKMDGLDPDRPKKSTGGGFWDGLKSAAKYLDPTYWSGDTKARPAPRPAAATRPSGSASAGPLVDEKGQPIAFASADPQDAIKAAYDHLRKPTTMHAVGPATRPAGKQKEEEYNSFAHYARLHPMDPNGMAGRWAPNLTWTWNEIGKEDDDFRPNENELGIPTYGRFNRQRGWYAFPGSGWPANVQRRYPPGAKDASMSGRINMDAEGSRSSYQDGPHGGGYISGGSEHSGSVRSGGGSRRNNAPGPHHVLGTRAENAYHFDRISTALEGAESDVMHAWGRLSHSPSFQNFYRFLQAGQRRINLNDVRHEVGGQQVMSRVDTYRALNEVLDNLHQPHIKYDTVIDHVTGKRSMSGPLYNPDALRGGMMQLRSLGRSLSRFRLGEAAEAAGYWSHMAMSGIGSYLPGSPDDKARRAIRGGFNRLAAGLGHMSDLISDQDQEDYKLPDGRSSFSGNARPKVRVQGMAHRTGTVRTPAASPDKSQTLFENKEQHGKIDRSGGESSATGGSGLNVTINHSEALETAVLDAIRQVRGKLAANDMEELLTAYKLRSEGTWV